MAKCPTELRAGRNEGSLYQSAVIPSGEIGKVSSLNKTDKLSWNLNTHGLG